MPDSLAKQIREELEAKRSTRSLGQTFTDPIINVPAVGEVSPLDILTLGPLAGLAIGAGVKGFRALRGAKAAGSVADAVAPTGINPAMKAARAAGPVRTPLSAALADAPKPVAHGPHPFAKPATEVVDPRPLTAHLPDQAEKMFRELSRKAILTPDEAATLERLRPIVQERASATGLSYAARGKSDKGTISSGLLRTMDRQMIIDRLLGDAGLPR